MIRPSASRLSASCAQLNFSFAYIQCAFEPGVHSVCETGPASLRPLSCTALGPRVIDRPRDSGSGGFAPSSPAQPRVTRRSAPLITVGPLSSLALFFLPRKNCPIEISFIPRGAGFFRGTWGRYLGLRRCVYRCSEQHPAPTSTCPCEYVARRPPHRRWVQETQPHTYGCAERILTAEFASFKYHDRVEFPIRY